MASLQKMSERPVIIDHVDYENTPSIDFDLGSLNSFRLPSPKAQKMTLCQQTVCLQSSHQNMQIYTFINIQIIAEAFITITKKENIGECQQKNQQNVHQN